MMIYRHGLRVSEAIGMRRDQLDIKRSRLWVERLKGSLSDEAALAPFRDALERLKEVPGLSETSAQFLLAEIGTDMRRFRTAGHLLSWAGLIPRLDESAGKRRSTRVRKGAPWLKPVFVQSA